MNIEQYEYMQGPHNAVGLKFLLHHQDAIPLVQDFGDHVPAGMHTFVAVSVSKVSSILFVFNGGNNTRIWPTNSKINRTHCSVLVSELLNA